MAMTHTRSFAAALALLAASTAAAQSGAPTRTRRPPTSARKPAATTTTPAKRPAARPTAARPSSDSAVKVAKSVAVAESKWIDIENTLGDKGAITDSGLQNRRSSSKWGVPDVYVNGQLQQVTP